MFSLMSRIFIDGRKNVGNCEDSPPTGENNSSELFRSVFIIKTFVRKFHLATDIKKTKIS